MKSNTKFLLAFIMATVLASGPAMAYSIFDINSGVNAPGATLIVDKNGTARLIGTVDSYYDRIRLERNAKKLEGVKRVINLLSFSS